MDKAEAYRLVQQDLQSRILLLEKGLADLHEGMSSDTKSTAGDKHETSRAMAHIEQEQLSTQLAQLQEHLRTIKQAYITKTGDLVAFGSLIETNKGRFFLSSGVGMIKGEMPFFCISMQTPMGQALLGKKKGDKVAVNGNELQIISVC